MTLPVASSLHFFQGPVGPPHAVVDCWVDCWHGLGNMSCTSTENYTENILTHF